MLKRPAPLYHDAPMYFSLVFLVAVVGFYPSYFSKQHEADVIHHFHGITATAWMLMLIAQSWWVRRGSFYNHRMLGRLSLLIAPLFVISGFLVIHAMLANQGGFSKAYGARLAFVDITTITYFAVAYGLAIFYRKTLNLHARFMATTAILLLPPALGRVFGGLVPGIESFDAAFHWSFGICEFIALALVIDDGRRGKVFLPYPMTLALLILQHVSFLVLPSVVWWSVFCAWIGSI